MGLPFAGSVHAQKVKANPGSGSTVKMRDFQWVSVILRKRAIAASPPLARQPPLGRLMNGVERCHFDHQIGDRRKLAIDEFKISQRRQE